LAEKDFAVLIVGYQRVEAIRSILDQCLLAEVRKVLLSLDFPKIATPETLANHERIQRLYIEYLPKFDSFLTRFLNVNIGCSANVLSSCDWAFSQHEAVAVLEDDCKPSQGFFEFCQESAGYLKTHSEVLLACGTQFVPEAERGVSPILSKYALTWGWFTDADHWKTIKSELILLSRQKKLNLITLDYERVYWGEGSRRAYQGYVDVWDTALVALINKSAYYSLLPPVNLISNIGNDSVATHTGQDKTWTNATQENYTHGDFGVPTVHAQADLWLKKNFYGITFRHLISTRITRIIDFLHKPKFDYLLNRWTSASKM
jgi:hypothetical protein